MGTLHRDVSASAGAKAETWELVKGALSQQAGIVHDTLAPCMPKYKYKSHGNQ